MQQIEKCDFRQFELRINLYKKGLDSNFGVRYYAEYPKNGAYKIGFMYTDLANLDNVRPNFSKGFLFVVHPYSENIECYNGEIICNDMDIG